VRRRLGAILFADVVGYTTLMEKDEERTDQSIRRYEALFESLCNTYNGKILEIRGDGFYLLFDSVVNAVSFGVEVQEIVESVEYVEDDIKFKIGINAGDLLTEAGSTVGDSVNIASRIENAACAGTVLISREVYDDVKYKLAFGYQCMGARKVKNVIQPVTMYRVRKDYRGASMATTSRNLSTANTNSNSLVVLPFKDVSWEPSAPGLSRGVSGDLAHLLSLGDGLLVIDPNAASCFDSSYDSPRQFGKRLGIQYVVDGEFDVMEDSIRLSANLHQSEHNSAQWSGQFDCETDDLMTVLAELANQILHVLGILMNEDQLSASGKEMSVNFQNYYLSLQAEQHLLEYTSQSNFRAREIFSSVLYSMPNYGRALTGMARTFVNEARIGWTNNSKESLGQASQYLQQAKNVNQSDAMTWALSGYLHLQNREYDAAIEEYQCAISLNPICTDIVKDAADAYLYTNQPEQCVELVKNAMLCNPFYPDEYLLCLGRAYFQQERYDDAIVAGTSVCTPATVCQLLAASYALVGGMEKARFFADMLYEVNPEFKIEENYQDSLYLSKDQMERIARGLRLAGF
jgi:class 3 adenylate cyclase/TolB-like protein